MAVCCVHYRLARLIGMLVHQRGPLIAIILCVLKLQLENYFDLSLLSFLNGKAFIEGKSFKVFWESGDDVFCSLNTICHFILIFYLPAFSTYMVHNNFKNQFRKKN